MNAVVASQKHKCHECGLQLRDGVNITVVYASDPIEEDSKLEFCDYCARYNFHRWTDGTLRTFPQGFDEEDSESDHGSFFDQPIDEYGTGGARCRKIGTSIPGLTDCGCEIEFLALEEDDDNVAEVIKRRCHKYIASVERDGSLDEYGAEVVTNYGPLDMILEGTNKVCKVLAENRCRSHKTSCCGLHVSISREGLTTYNIARFVVFWNNPKNQEFLRAFARRWNAGYCKPKQEKSSMPPKGEPLSRIIFNNDRYELVNLQNRRRIEIRAFRGTTKASTVRACISLCVWLMAYCRTDGALTYTNFIDWCGSAEFSRKDEKFTPQEILDYWKDFNDRKNTKANDS